MAAVKADTSGSSAIVIYCPVAIIVTPAGTKRNVWPNTGCAAVHVKILVVSKRGGGGNTKRITEIVGARHSIAGSGLAAADSALGV